MKSDLYCYKPRWEFKTHVRSGLAGEERDDDNKYN